MSMTTIYNYKTGKHEQVDLNKVSDFSVYIPQTEPEQILYNLLVNNFNKLPAEASFVVLKLVVGLEKWQIKRLKRVSR